jgi:hypothetical protein
MALSKMKLFNKIRVYSFVYCCILKELIARFICNIFVYSTHLEFTLEYTNKLIVILTVFYQKVGVYKSLKEKEKKKKQKKEGGKLASLAASTPRRIERSPPCFKPSFATAPA